MIELSNFVKNQDENDEKRSKFEGGIVIHFCSVEDYAIRKTELSEKGVFI